MNDIFAQAAKDALALLGGGALLRGGVPCQVNIERGVHLEGLDFNPTVERYTTVTQDIASIESSLDPKVGDALTVNGAKYKLDALVVDSGFVRRFVVVKV